MKQYQQIKGHYEDCLLFFRLGDFYELFLDDAKVGSEVLDITLTSRPKGKDGRIPMCGVPYHAVDAYIARLVKAGYKVAICEQISEPDTKGIVEREVVRVVTPGTVLDEKALERKSNNYMVSIACNQDSLAVCSADISTGQLVVHEQHYDNIEHVIGNELARIRPSECILSPESYDDGRTVRIIRHYKAINIFNFQGWDNYAGDAVRTLKRHFGVTTLKGFGLESVLSTQAVAAMIGYLSETQKGNIGHMRHLSRYESDAFVSLDRATIMNLELFSTLREQETQGTLLSILDETKTPMGGRLLKEWLKSPLSQRTPIASRHQAVESLIAEASVKKTVEATLLAIHDIERTFSRLSVGLGNARDMNSLMESLRAVLSVKHALVPLENKLLTKLQRGIATKLTYLIQRIGATIQDEPAFSLKEGGIIKPGVDRHLDELKALVGENTTWILELEQAEKARSGISSLKIRYNQVFGYYIEISKSNMDKVPTDYMRKQTLVNAERFITPALKEKEALILQAQEEINTIEYSLYQDLLAFVLSHTGDIQKAARNIAAIDCLVCFAQVSMNNHYVKPTLVYSNEFKVINGRHPVVEQLLEKGTFVPNSISLDTKKQTLLIITGPNMAGKSVLIRQVALIALMNQIGCFVPADRAYLPVVDKIFVRSGASDVITSGLSTFMVEMVETAYILNHATDASLIVMDEIGRGTSTYDGISIAWATAEYLVRMKPSPKTLFATHYHELTKLEEIYPGKIRNYHLEVKEHDGEPIFIHQFRPGKASESFGVAVAALAGVPDWVIDRASEILKTLKEDHVSVLPKPMDPLREKLASLSVDTMTPIDALTALSELKKL